MTQATRNTSPHSSQTAPPGYDLGRSLDRPSPGAVLEARLSEVIETATSTYLSALDNDEQATAKLHVQKTAQAADEAWQQTIVGLQNQASQTRSSHPSNTQAPPKMKTVMIWTSQRPGGAGSVRHNSKRSSHGSLIRLDSGVYTPLQGCLAAGDKD